MESETHTSRHFNIGEVDYAKKMFEVNQGLVEGIRLSDTIYIHLPRGVRAVKVTSVTLENHMAQVFFENLTAP